jgi:hypothetical protein
VAAAPLDPNVLAGTRGYLVADVHGRVVGRVERAASAENGRITVRSGLLVRRRRIVLPADIDEIDQTAEIIALRVEREALRSV